jgi:branched-chain amino acid transport system substrate-binding protein
MKRRARRAFREGVGRAIFLAVALGAAAAGRGQDRPAPVVDLRTRETSYLGPGRETAPPADLREVRLAWFGPPDDSHPEWGDGWRGACLAIEEANAAGGYDGHPFRLLSAWSESPWGSGVADLAKLVYDQGAWAVVGGVDGTTTHLAEQVVVKARLPLVSPGGTDPSVNFTAVPWMFTLLPTDDRIAPVLADAVLDEAEGGGWAVVSTTNRDARVAWRALRAVLAGRRSPAPSLHLALPAGTPDFGGAAADVVRAGAGTVLVLAGPRDAARAVRALRGAGFEGRIVGGAPAGRRPFVEEAGPAAEGVLFPLLFDPARPGADAFTLAYRARWGSAPDYLAAHAYDAARLVAQAVRRAGPNRALVRDALAALAPWDGAAGRVTWDLTGRSDRRPSLGVWRAGRARAAAGLVTVLSPAGRALSGPRAGGRSGSALPRPDG